MSEKRPVWLSRADWRAGVVRSDAKKPNAGVFLVGAIAVGIFFLALSKDDARALTALLLVTSAIVAFGYWMRRIRMRRLGIAELRFDRVPFVFASKMTAKITVPFEAPPATVHLRLNSQVSGDEDPVWCGVWDVPPAQLKRERGRTVVPVDLEVPLTGEPTAHTLMRAVTWTLIVKFDLPDYEAAFDVPVAEIDAPVIDTLQRRAQRHSLRAALSVFDAPEDHASGRTGP